MATRSTIPYHLRPQKAIDRNIFLAILHILDRAMLINIRDYRYVGFGGAFLEEYKILHLEHGIIHMDCIEQDQYAYTRQIFNNPYNFIKFYRLTSTDYIAGTDFKQDKNQIIWLDYTTPKLFRQQLIDIELAAQKVTKLDILKFTFNAAPRSFLESNNIEAKPEEFEKIIKLLLSDQTFKEYLPDDLKVQDIANDFSILFRIMAIRAVKRGLAKVNSEFDFNHIASFKYEDGQKMTTICGIISDKVTFKEVCKQTDLTKWPFFQPDTPNNIIPAHEINVTSMTIKERIEIDKKMPTKNVKRLAKSLSFRYGNDSEQEKMIKGYHSYYKYLPYYSKVTY